MFWQQAFLEMHEVIRKRTCPRGRAFQPDGALTWISWARWSPYLDCPRCLHRPGSWSEAGSLWLVCKNAKVWGSALVGLPMISGYRLLSYLRDAPRSLPTHWTLSVSVQGKHLGHPQPGQQSSPLEHVSPPPQTHPTSHSGLQMLWSKYHEVPGGESFHKFS